MTGIIAPKTDTLTRVYDLARPVIFNRYADPKRLDATVGELQDTALRVGLGQFEVLNACMDQLARIAYGYVGTGIKIYEPAQDAIVAIGRAYPNYWERRLGATAREAIAPSGEAPAIMKVVQEKVEKNAPKPSFS